MNQSRLAMALLLFALLAGTGLRLLGQSAKSTIAHDEAISYVCATGHLTEYHRTVDQEMPPYGAWAPASQWKRFWSLEHPFCFDRIRDASRLIGIDPPLPTIVNPPVPR